MIRARELADSAPDGEDWYANLLWSSGRKCLLLTHVATLFTVFEPDVRAADFRDPGRLVAGLIKRELLREQLPPDTFGDLETAEVVLAKTTPPHQRRSERSDAAVLPRRWPERSSPCARR